MKRLTGSQSIPALLCLFLVVFAGPLSARASDEEALRVGVRNVPPFSMTNGAGEWTGLAVDLWKGLAEERGWTYTFVEEPTVDALLDALRSGEIDLVTSGLSITPEREEAFDFAHPFLSSHLGILSLMEEENRWLRTIRSAFSLPFLAALGSLSLVLLGAGAALYFFERRQNPDQFSEEPVSGLGAAFWWAAVTMTTVGYGDKAPVSLGGRLVALFWMFLSVIILSTFTASIVSSLALPSTVQSIRSLSDIRAGEVATVAGSTAEDLLEANQLRPLPVASLYELKAVLGTRGIKAIVYDMPSLQFLLRELSADAYLVDLPRQREDYGFALPQGSSLREDLTIELLQYLNTPEWFALKARYLP